MRRSRSAAVGRGTVAAVTAVVLAIVMSGCGGGAPSRFVQLLRPGVQNADTQFTGYVDDLGALARQGEVVVPAELDDAVRQTQAEVASGAQLSDEETRLLAAGEQLVAAYDKLDTFVQLASTWSAAVPDDAARLVGESTFPEANAEFRAELASLEQRALRALMCNAAGTGLDAAGQAQAAAAQPSYDFVGLTAEDVGAFIQGELLDQGWADLRQGVDLLALAVNTVGVHNSYVTGILDVAESPNGAIAAANVVYFRNCVL